MAKKKSKKNKFNEGDKVIVFRYNNGTSKNPLKNFPEWSYGQIREIRDSGYSCLGESKGEEKIYDIDYAKCCECYARGYTESAVCRFDKKDKVFVDHYSGNVIAYPVDDKRGRKLSLYYDQLSSVTLRCQVILKKLNSCQSNPSDQDLEDLDKVRREFDDVFHEVLRIIAPSALERE